MSTMPSKADLKKNLKLLKARLEDRPMDLDARMRIARTYRLLNDSNDAVAHYAAVARYLSLAGHPLQAIAVLKELLQVNAKHEETLLFLAKLYARTRAADATNRGRVAIPIHEVSSPFDDGGVEALADGLPQTATGIWRAIRPDETGESQMIREADEVGAEVEPEEVEEDNVSALEDSNIFEDSVLTRVALFAALDAKAFMSLGHAMMRQSAAAGDVIFSPGDPGDSCLVITKGTARVSRMIDGNDVEIDRLHPGDLAGIFTLVTAEVRQATLTAETDLEYFEIDHLAVTELVQKHPTARSALSGFMRDRLVAALLLDVPLFAKLNSADKKLLTESFNEKELADGDELFNAFHENDGLWIIVDGAGVVGDEGEVEGKLKELATLRVGDWVASLSGTLQQEAGLTALARGRTLVISLPHRVLAPLLAASGTDTLGPMRVLNKSILVGSIRR